jgi:glucosylceramidase
MMWIFGLRKVINLFYCRKQSRCSFLSERTSNTNADIDVDTTQSFQTIDGFGFTLTGGSAYVINQLDATVKANLLKELFSNDSNSIGISYLRISIGASDLNASVFSYDDVPPGQTDMNLDMFTLHPDETDLIPLLKEILLINPGIKILGAPWSAPVWMKDNNSSVGGSLRIQYYDCVCKIFRKIYSANEGCRHYHRCYNTTK